VVKRINGDLVEHGELVGGDDGVTYDRPHRTFYNPYGLAAVLPADPIQMSIWMEAGWSLHKPSKPLEKPATQKMRDGSEFVFSTGAADVSEAEWERINASPTDRRVAAGPVATYWTAQGGELPNLPADPESMAKYLAAGLLLDPPSADKAPSAKARPTRLRVLQEA
jgi:hypothetical protein